MTPCNEQPLSIRRYQRYRTHGGRVAHWVCEFAHRNGSHAVALCGKEIWTTAHTAKDTPNCQACERNLTR